MLKKILLLSSALLIITSTGNAKPVAGIDMPDNIAAGKDKLVLNGAGTRTKFFIKAYVGGLYLKQQSSDANAIMNADEPVAIRLHIISKMITPQKMTDAINEGFQNSTKGNIAPYKAQIDEFLTVFKEVKINDIFDIIYTPGDGTKIYKNNKLLVTSKGLAFKKVLYGIWLCDKPADKSLKAAMLGK